MRKFLITVNGQSYEVEVDEIVGATPSLARPSVPVAAASAPAAAPAAPASEPAVAPAPKSTGAPEGSRRVVSPMPGTIVDVRVKEGDAVKLGQVLLILEAMKMENEILAPKDGVVAAVMVQKGASVGSGDVLAAIN